MPLGDELVFTLRPPSAGRETLSLFASTGLRAGAGSDGTSIRRPAVTVRFGTGEKRSSP